MVKSLAGQLDMFDLLSPPKTEFSTPIRGEVRPLSYVSMCSGIESASVAAHPLGWQPVAFSEIEKFPSAVLEHHYPDVPNLGDMSKVDWSAYRAKVDLVVAGTPCQPFSLAGARRGLDDARGNLALVFTKAIDEINPAFTLWENVPGVLCSKDNAFGCFLAGLAGEDVPIIPPGGKWTDAGYVSGPKRTVAWRVLNAEHFKLAQRRRRVFALACPVGGADPREILFEFDGERRDTPPSREQGKAVAALASSGVGTGGADGSQAQAGRLITEPIAFSCKDYGADATIGLSPTLRAMGHAESHANAGDQMAVAYRLQTFPILEAGARTGKSTTDVRAGIGIGGPEDPMFTLQAGKQHAVAYGDVDSFRVRRLTPEECEKLMGFPQGYTNVPYRGKPSADGPRYKTLGNSKAVPVVRWIFERIAAAAAKQ